MVAEASLDDHVQNNGNSTAATKDDARSEPENRVQKAIAAWRSKYRSPSGEENRI